MLFGFVINPYAGLGINYRMKGSDSIKDVSVSTSYSIDRARSFLLDLEEGIRFYVPSGEMGENAIKERGNMVYDVITNPHPPFTRDDTIEFAMKASEICDLIIFVGGDGTARDIVNGNTEDKPIIGIPAGMKMYSSVFASTPEAAASIINRVHRTGNMKIQKGEVLDLNEELFQQGTLDVKKYAEAFIPLADEVVRDPKNVYSSQDTGMIAEYILDTMDDSYYIVGTGTTCKMILQKLGFFTNPLGVDLIKDKKLIASDIYPEDFKKYYEGGRVKLILTPTGGQGYILGRGNRQINMDILKFVKKEDLIVISSQQKANDLKGLRVDMEGFSEYFQSNYIRVVIGYSDFRIMKLLSS